MLDDLPRILELELPDTKNLVRGLTECWERRWRGELLNPRQSWWEFGSGDPQGSCSLEIQSFWEISRSHLSSVIKWKGREGNDP